MDLFIRCGGFSGIPEGYGLAQVAGSPRDPAAFSADVKRFPHPFLVFFQVLLQEIWCDPFAERLFLRHGDSPFLSSGKIRFCFQSYPSGKGFGGVYNPEVRFFSARLLSAVFFLSLQGSRFFLDEILPSP